jgi:ring-1,2-phenylacetyl-CoA epoxidase subunit PaaC
MTETNEAPAPPAVVRARPISSADRARITEQADVVDYLLRIGDDCLVLSQQLGEWCGHAPEIEEDVAMANIALDLLGQARLLLSRAGELEGRGRDEDALAYWRDDRSYTNCLLVEVPNGDFAMTMLRHLLFSTYHLALTRALSRSSDAFLAGFGAKAASETAYHLDHATQWTLRLGAGTPESHRRATAALEVLWPYRLELYQEDPLVARLSERGIAPAPSSLRPGVEQQLRDVLDGATLHPPRDHRLPSGGRSGRHGEHLGHLLAEMQHLHRSHPGASW